MRRSTTNAVSLLAMAFVACQPTVKDVQKAREKKDVGKLHEYLKEDDKALHLPALEGILAVADADAQAPILKEVFLRLNEPELVDAVMATLPSNASVLELAWSTTTSPPVSVKQLAHCIERALIKDRALASKFVHSHVAELQARYKSMPEDLEESLKGLSALNLADDTKQELLLAQLGAAEARLAGKTNKTTSDFGALFDSAREIQGRLNTLKLAGSDQRCTTSRIFGSNVEALLTSGSTPGVMSAIDQGAPLLCPQDRAAVNARLTALLIQGLPELASSAKSISGKSPMPDLLPLLKTEAVVHALGQINGADTLAGLEEQVKAAIGDENKILQQVEAISSKERDLAGLRASRKDYALLRGYMVAREKDDLYEIATSLYRNHSLLKTTSTQFTSRGWFKLWVTREPDREISTINGFSETWRVYREADKDTVADLDGRISKSAKDVATARKEVAAASKRAVSEIKAVVASAHNALKSAETKLQAGL